MYGNIRVIALQVVRRCSASFVTASRWLLLEYGVDPVLGLLLLALADDVKMSAATSPRLVHICYDNIRMYDLRVFCGSMQIPATLSAICTRYGDEWRNNK